jgi:hypothetical protein
VGVTNINTSRIYLLISRSLCPLVIARAATLVPKLDVEGCIPEVCIFIIVGGGSSAHSADLKALEVGCLEEVEEKGEGWGGGFEVAL